MLEAFETARMLIRPFDFEDLRDLHDLYSSQEVMRYVTSPRALEETKNRLNKHIEDRERCGFGLFATLLKSDGSLIGRCGLDPIDKNRELQGDIAWMFAPKYWGNGLATEFGSKMIEVGFTELCLPRIFAIAHRDNIASIRVMEKLKMKYVGCKNERVEYEVLRS